MDGVLLIDKPPGMGSAEVVRRIRRMVKPARVGHLGTLDPLATGLLPILIGEATKLAQFLEGGEKHYQGVIALGIETDTCDSSGRAVRSAAVPVLTEQMLADVARRFTGEVHQVPPVFSAIKRAGVPLYKLARRGGEVEPPPSRLIVIGRLELEAIDPEHLRFFSICSSGTYLRALARDLGAALGSAGHLANLRRLRTAGFGIEQAHALDEVLAAGSQLAPHLIGLSQALPEMAEVEVDQLNARRLRNGDISVLLRSVKLTQGEFKIVCEGGLVAIVQASPEHGMQLARVFAG